MHRLRGEGAAAAGGRCRPDTGWGLIARGELPAPATATRRVPGAARREEYTRLRQFSLQNAHSPRLRRVGSRGESGQRCVIRTGNRVRARVTAAPRSTDSRVSHVADGRGCPGAGTTGRGTREPSYRPRRQRDEGMGRTTPGRLATGFRVFRTTSARGANFGELAANGPSCSPLSFTTVHNARVKEGNSHDGWSYAFRFCGIARIHGIAWLNANVRRW